MNKTQMNLINLALKRTANHDKKFDGSAVEFNPESLEADNIILCVPRNL